MERELLEKLGLNRKEIAVYLALLEIGQSRSGRIVKKSGVPSSKIYGVLGSLAEKGLVGVVHKGGIKEFGANHPSVLRHLLELKERELEGMGAELEHALPALEKEYQSENEEYRVEILEGLRGIKSVYDLSLGLCGKGGEMCTMGYPLLASTLLNAYFRQYHKKLREMGVKARVIYDYDTWFGKEREERPNARQRYLPKGVKTPAFVHIFKGHVGIMVVTQKQKLCILIRNKEVSQSYLQYFNLLWKISKSGTKRKIK
jgi:HTH-type transcriptional regulator, sugar sensing transcriptional regulator